MSSVTYDSGRTSPRVHQILRQAFALLPADRRKRWFLLVAVATFGGVVESLGAILVLTVMGLLTGSEPSQLPITLPSFLAPTLGDPTNFAIFAAAFFLLRAVLLVGQSYFQNRVVHQTGLAISSELLGGYLQMPYVVQQRRDSTELIRNAFTSVSDVVGAVLSPAALILSEAFLVVGVVSVLVLAQPLASLMTVVVLLPVMTIIMALIQPRLASLGASSHASHHMTLRWLQKGVQGLREIKLFHREEQVRRQFEISRAELSRALYLRATIVELPRLTVETLMLLFILSLVVVNSARQGPSEEAVSFLGLVAYAVLRVMPSLNRIVSNLNSVQFGGAAVEAVHSDLSGIRSAALEPVRESESTQTRIEFRSLALKGITFRYPAADKSALDRISLEIERGEFIGIVGPSGSGKSTLIDLVLGLIDPLEGSVIINDDELSAIRRAWQRSLGIVPQTVFLLDDTLLENITFGTPDEDFDERRLSEALEGANLQRLIGRLPEGIHSHIGERGNMLSGGERQRVAIARALYRDPEVLIFDEGLSALDAITERTILTTAKERFRDRTIISVAHRVSSLRECDRIFVLDEGRVDSLGTYDTLMETSPLFRELAFQPIAPPAGPTSDVVPN